MRKFLTILSICTMMILTSCSHAKENKRLPDYSDLDTLQENYTISDAKKANCVVFEDNVLVSGEDEWNLFLELSTSGKTATIRIANYYSNDKKVPIIDLSFDGTSYTVKEKGEAAKQYSYLNHYTVDGNKDSSYTQLDAYILVNDSEVTYYKLERSTASSNSKDFIDHYQVYANYKND